jgi:hypothetical protein
MENSTKIEKGQKITFEYYGKTVTKKVIQVVTRGFNTQISYNVNPIGSGTQYIGVYHEDVISVK